MKNYTYTQSVQYYVSKIEGAVSSKQAWFFLGRITSLKRFHDFSDEQLASHDTFCEGIAKKLNEHSPKPSYDKAVKPSVKAVVTQPKVSKNGRANQKSKIDAVIANLNAAVDILKTL